MLNSLHFIRGFTKLLQSGIWFLNEGKNFWDILNALLGLCVSQRSHHLPRTLCNLKVQSLSNCPWFLDHSGGSTFSSEVTVRVPATKKSFRNGMIDFAFQPKQLFSCSFHYLSPSLFFFSAKSLRVFVWTNMEAKEKCPSIIWIRCSFIEQSLDCTWRLSNRPFFRK